jgi:hypothetical protein
MEVRIVDGVRCFVFTKEPVPQVKITKAAQERARKAVVGRGLGKKRNSVRRPSDCIVTTF